ELALDPAAPPLELPRLSPHAQADLRSARAAQRKVFYKHLPPLFPGACPNCGGHETHWLQFVTGGPYPAPNGGKEPLIWQNGRWWRVESRVYPCPVCADPNERLFYLFQRSGLEPEEHAWQLDFLEGRAGKQHALRSARRLLDQSPYPAGWLVLFGAHGVGKSGVLKSVVAACVRAGVPARYVRAGDILQEIRATFGEASQLSEAGIAAEYGRYQVLAVDEIDRISNTPWAQSTLMLILDTRYARRKQLATLMATNLQPEGLPPGMRYLASRMKDGFCASVEGEDLRGTPESFGEG
ncbi:MAG TPA: ATP-binding protein, partial [Firmicutes bacterium]|nr:ATP-binding protein [Bacillota bacterium]